MSRPTFALFWVYLATIALVGCGAEDAKNAMYRAEMPPAPTEPTFRGYAPTSPAPKSAASMSGMAGMMAMGAPAAADQADKKIASAAPAPEGVERKIIYNASVDLTIKELTAAEKSLKELVQQTKGYISETNITGHSGSKRRGTWKIRVPVEGFSDFVAAVIKLGELENTRSDSQDVTAEFYDIDARIKNKQQEEIRLKKILDEAAGNLKDILEVEKEITRVRGDIEQMQGRLRVLASLSSLSTVTLTMTEVETFSPPERPTFAQKIGRTFAQSNEDLAMFMGNMILGLTGFIPWLLWFWLPLFAIVFILSRIARRWMKSRPAGEPAIPPASASV